MTLLLTVFSGVAAVVYGICFCQRDVSAGRSILKTAGVGLLAAVALFGGGPPLLALALVVSAIGDFALSRSGERAFLAGLGSFALAHVAYILLFLVLGAGWPWLLPAFALVLYALSTEFWLAPHTGEMRWPVRIYVALLSGMGLAALTLPPSLVWAKIGAFAFVVSDSLLAVQLFRLSPEAPGHRIVAPAIWALYYVAQALILWAILG